MRRLRLVVIAMALGGSAFAQEPTASPIAAPEATPAPTPPEELRSTGERHMRLGRYQDALQTLLAAYDASPDPELLLPIARCYGALEEWDRAAFYAEEYLHSASAAERPRAEALLAEAKDEAAKDREMERLTRLLDDGSTTATATTSGAIAMSSPLIASNTVVAPASTTEAPAIAVRPPPPVTRAKPLHRQWWAWTAAGVAVLAAGAAAASSRAPADRKTMPEGDLGTIDRRNP